MESMWRWIVAVLASLSADPAEARRLEPRAAAACAIAYAELAASPVGPVTPPAPTPPAPPKPNACPGGCDCVDGWIGDRNHRSPCPCPKTCPCKRAAATPSPPAPAVKLCPTCLGTLWHQGADGVIRRCRDCCRDGRCPL
jgi:hypothetical protein